MKTIIISALLLVLLTTTVIAQTPALIAEGADIRLSLVNQQPDPAAPGEVVDVRIKIENRGSSTASDLEVQFIQEDPFTIVGAGTALIGDVQSSQRGDNAFVEKFSIKIDDNAADATFPFTVAYRFNNGPWIQRELTGIEVQSSISIVTVDDVDVENIAPGSQGTVSISLRNFAASTVEDINAKLVVQGTDFTPVGTSNTRFIRRIAGGQNAILQFPLAVASDATARVQDLSLEFSYSDILGSKRSENVTIGIPIVAEPSYVFALEDTEVYTLGSTGDIVVSISNTGPANIRFLTIELEDSKNYRVLSAPTIYVGNLESDDFETASFTVNLKEGEENIGLNAILTFSDDYNEKITERHTLQLPILSSGEAKAYGLTSNGANIPQLFFGIAVQILLLIFTAFMLIDLMKQRMIRYRKILWGITILTVIGAFIYYFVGRKKA